MKRLDGVTLQVDGQRVLVQAGATFDKVNELLNKHGRALPVWPTSAPGATIGGWISTGGHAGFGTARYGGFAKQVEELEVVRPLGKIVHLTESSAIARFFETCGTLGIIVSAKIKIVPDAKVSTFCFTFQSSEEMRSTITEILAAKEKPLFVRFSDKLHDRLAGIEKDSPWMLLVSVQGDSHSLIDIVQNHNGKYLGDEFSRLRGNETVFYETLPKGQAPVLMLQQFLMHLESCFHLIEAGRRLATNLRLPLACAGTVTSIECVRLVLEIPTDNTNWIQFMSSKALLHKIVKDAYGDGHGKVYTSGMLNAMYMAKFERDTVNKWLAVKDRIDPVGVLNPLKHGRSRMSYLRIDILFLINIAWRRFQVLTNHFVVIRDYSNLDDSIADLPMKQCAYCAACRDVCPVYSVSRNEAVYPGGRLRAIMTYERNALPMDAQLSSNLLACTICGACKSSCPLKIDHTAFIIDRRMQNAAIDGNANEKHEAMRDSFIREGNVYGEPRAHRLDWLQGDEASQFHIVERGDIAYFVGCTAAFRSRETAVSTLLILSRIVPGGVVILGNDEACCGGPLVRVGQEQRADVSARVHELVQRFVKRGVKRVIFSCPGCYSSATDFWPRLLGKELPFEVMHIVEFVAGEIRAGQVQFKENPIDVTYHDPCHLGRQLGIFDAPREILAAIPGVRVVEMEHNREKSMCCGAGGGMCTALPSITSTLASRRMDEAIRTRTSTVVTSCVFCEQTFKKVIEVSHAPMSCVDIVELLSRSIVASNQDKKAGGSK